MSKLMTEPSPHIGTHDVSHDGVKPMQACCVKCGYRFGGVPIKEGILTCPECGEENEFEFQPIRRGHLIWLAILRITLFGLGGLALLAALLWMTGAAALLQKARTP